MMARIINKDAAKKIAKLKTANKCHAKINDAKFNIQLTT